MTQTQTLRGILREYWNFGRFASYCANPFSLIWASRPQDTILDLHTILEKKWLQGYLTWSKENIRYVFISLSQEHYSIILTQAKITSNHPHASIREALMWNINLIFIISSGFCHSASFHHHFPWIPKCSSPFCIKWIKQIENMKLDLINEVSFDRSRLLYIVRVFGLLRQRNEKRQLI